MTNTRILGLSALVAAMATVGFAQMPSDGPRGHGSLAMPAFEALDTDGDGRITREEMQAQRAARVAALDADGDGKITLEELKAHHMRQAEDRAERMARRMIESMDSDGDGALSAAELAAGPAPMMAMFDRIDTDGDGAISKDEAEAMRNRMADRMERRGKSDEHRGHGARDMKHGN
ncbi:MAG: EF-hand domain-containing protein [Gemmobacter sp.]